MKDGSVKTKIKDALRYASLFQKRKEVLGRRGRFKEERERRSPAAAAALIENFLFVQLFRR